MKNLNSYKGDSIAFFEKVLNSKYDTKSDIHFKVRILILKPTLIDKFDKYDSFFKKDNLVKLEAFGFDGQNKLDLQKLYSFNLSPFKQLEIDLTTDINNNRDNTCQNCTINSVGSFDHFVPKGNFAEFAIHPRNLFPSCIKCNGHKSAVWRKGGKIVFLNLYLDTLPKVQYLFVNLTFEKNMIEPTFYLKNKSHINNDLFTRIENHYTRLHLFNRFKKKSGRIIESLKNVIIPYKDCKLTKKQIIEITTNKIKHDQSSFGFNYWVSILELALINSKEFMDNILK